MISNTEFKTAVIKVLEELQLTIEAANLAIHTVHQRVETLEHYLDPVTWICQIPYCGSPNQTPRLLFPDLQHQTAFVSLICTQCHCIQDTKVMQQFL